MPESDSWGGGLTLAQLLAQSDSGEGETWGGGLTLAQFLANAADGGAGPDIVTLSGTQTLTNKTLGDLKETVFTVVDDDSVDLNPANGPIQTWTLGANRTPTATSFVAGQSMMTMIDDGTAFAITWTMMGVAWVGGTAPTLATTGYTVVEFWKVGSTLYGAHVGDVA
jgi:hypothetical protein